MDKKTELLNILKAELTLLTKEILQNIHQQDLDELYKASRKLYEKMAAINLIDKQFGEETAVNLLVSGATENKKTSETLTSDNPVKKGINQEKKQPENNPYQQVNRMNFIPKDKSVKPTENSRSVSTNPAGKKINIGLNDKIAFIQNLFEGDHEAYSKVIDKLNAFDSYEAALTYIYQDVKPMFNQWEGKDEYEFRLIQLLELKFN
jgi:hypothetical protein